MANSIRNNAEFRALLTRANGATGSELQEFTGRAYVYSTWSLRCMETETHELWTQKDGKETRYMLKSKARIAANEARRSARKGDASDASVAASA